MQFVLDTFNNGVISPEAQGRVNARWYLSSLKECKNGVITKYGNILKRPGTEFINLFTEDIDLYKIIPFKKEDGDLLLIFVRYSSTGYVYMYVYKNGAFVLDSTGTQYSLYIDICNNIDISQMDYVQKNDVMYIMCNGIKKLIHIADNEWSVSAVTPVIRYVLGYGNGISMQVTGVLPSMFLRELRSGNNTFITLKYTLNGVQQTAVVNADGTITGTGLQSVSSIDLNTGSVVIKSALDMVSSFYYWTSGATVGVGKIIQASNGAIFKCTTGGTTGTAEPDWNAVVLGGTVTDNTAVWTCIGVPFTGGSPVYFDINLDIYPKKVCMYEDRLILANFENYEDVIWASNVGSYESFVFGVNSGDAFMYEISSEYANDILWVIGLNGLLIGTPTAIYLMQGGEAGITSTTVSVTKQSQYGTADVKPVLVGSSVIYVSQNAQRLYKITYSWNVQGYVSGDLNVINDVILSARVKKIAFENMPYTRIWALLKDGTFAVLTFFESEDVVAWQTIETAGEVLDFDIIEENAKSHAYIFVNRDAVSQSVEHFKPYSYDTYFDTVFSDCSMIYKSSTAQDTFSVPYNDGTEVVIFTAEGLHQNVTVAEGQVSLDWATTYAAIGLAYTYSVETVNIEFAQQGEIVSLGSPKQISRICVYLYKSMGGKIYINDAYWLLFRTPNDLMGEILPLYTGCKDADINLSITDVRNISFKVVHVTPMPFNMLGIKFDVLLGAV